MVIHINVTRFSQNKGEKNAKLHWMPCIIKSDGEAKVSDYFEPIVVKHRADSLKSSFRGRLLLGKKVRVPKNYCGMILKEVNEKMNEDDDRNIYETDKFEKFIYWNQDIEPSGSDKIIMAMEWLEIAEALHACDDS